MTDQNSNTPADVVKEEVVVAPADAAEVAVEVAPEEVTAPADAEVPATEVVVEATPEVTA